MTSTSTKPVDNVVITTKGLQDRNIHIFDGTPVENKGKLILLCSSTYLFSLGLCDHSLFNNVSINFLNLSYYSLYFANFISQYNHLKSFTCIILLRQ